MLQFLFCFLSHRPSAWMCAPFLRVSAAAITVAAAVAVAVAAAVAAATAPTPVSRQPTPCTVPSCQPPAASSQPPAASAVQRQCPQHHSRPRAPAHRRIRSQPRPAPPRRPSVFCISVYLSPPIHVAPRRASRPRPRAATIRPSAPSFGGAYEQVKRKERALARFVRRMHLSKLFCTDHTIVLLPAHCLRRVVTVS